MPHAKLLVVTDDNELEYVKTITHDSKGKKLTEPYLEYIYTKSGEKLGMILPITQNDIDTKIRKGIFEILNK